MANVESLARRFWKKVSCQDCWIWLGSKTKRGYGLIRDKGKWETAHRASWRIHFGEIPEGQFVCHHCDNPSCVHPHHLFLGTHAENMADRDAKGRNVRPSDQGEGHWCHKLTESDVRAIRASELSCAKLAKQYGVRPSTVWMAKTGVTWGHLK